ncbi:HAD family hydrolase [Uniformispora flossi]|uniref:HAD family hydrolase n=1 Tax=Uniformispora flossi TaxID=3390723 RepID=UPI003C2BD729
MTRVRTPAASAGMRGIAALAIDFSGTLARPGPNPDGARVADIVASQLDRDMPPGFAPAFDTAIARIHRADHATERHTPFADAIAQAARRSGLTDLDPAAAAEAVFAAVPDAAVDGRAADAVRRLTRQGWRCVLACNTERSGRARARTLDAAGLTGCFAGSVLSGEVGYRKPHPRFYEAVVTACGVPAPHILFVGDHPEKDVLGPRRHGMIALRVARLGSPAPAAGGMLGHLADLPDFLASMGAWPRPGAAEAVRGLSAVSTRPPPARH